MDAWMSHSGPEKRLRNLNFVYIESRKEYWFHWLLDQENLPLNAVIHSNAHIAPRLPIRTVRTGSLFLRLKYSPYKNHYGIITEIWPPCIYENIYYNLKSESAARKKWFPPFYSKALELARTRTHITHTFIIQCSVHEWLLYCTIACQPRLYRPIFVLPRGLAHTHTPRSII